MFSINNHEDLLVGISKLLEKEIGIGDIKISDNFKFHIIISGDNRDGKLDADVAKLVLKIQNLVYNYYSIAFNMSVDDVKKQYSKDIRVTATINEGSDIFTADITSLVSQLVGKMTDTQSFITSIVAIGAFVACYSVAKYVDYQKDKRQTISDAEKDQRLNASLDKALEIIENTMKPHDTQDIDQALSAVSKEVIKNMDKDDTITIISTEETIGRNIFAKRFPKLLKSSQYIYLDGKYGISEVTRTDEGVYKIRITDNEGESIKGIATLSQNDLKILINELIPSEPQSLQVNANVDSEGKLTEAAIIGFGNPRKDSITISDAKKVYDEE